MEGEKEVGLTIHKVDRRADHGDILLIRTVPTYQETAEILGEEIAKLAPAVLKEAVTSIIDGTARLQRQDDKHRKYWKPPGFFERIKYRKYL